MPGRIRALSLGMLLVVAASTAEAGSRPTAAERSAQSLIRKQAKAICEYAYPTLKYSRVEYKSGTRYRDGSFRYSYKFHCKSGSKANYFYLNFAFRKNGKMTAITYGPRTLFLPPFTTAQFLIAMLKSEIRKDKKLKDNIAVRKILKEANAKSLVILIMNIKSGKL